MTGATGNLTPDDADQAFVPAELREISDPAHQADVTIAQGAAAESQSRVMGEPADELPEGGPTNLAPRDSGYGSEHGLSPNDPAYRMATRPHGRFADRSGHEPREPREPRVGGDEATDHEEHF